MDDKHAAAVLLALLKKYPLTEEEKEAISNAVGILGWTSLADSRRKVLREKRIQKEHGSLED